MIRSLVIYGEVVHKSKFGKQKEELIFNGTEIVKRKSEKENYNLEIIRDIIETVNKVQDKLMIQDLNIELTVTKSKEIYILQARNLI